MINDMVQDFPEIESELFAGGPVGTDTLHYIHNIGDLLMKVYKSCGSAAMAILINSNFLFNNNHLPGKHSVLYRLFRDGPKGNY